MEAQAAAELNAQARSMESLGKYVVNKSLVHWLLTLSTTAAIGTFAFLWKINASFATYQERDLQKTETVNEIKASIAHLQDGVNEVKEKMVRIETIQSEQAKK